MLALNLEPTSDEIVWRQYTCEYEKEDLIRFFCHRKKSVTTLKFLSRDFFSVQKCGNQHAIIKETVGKAWKRTFSVKLFRLRKKYIKKLKIMKRITNYDNSRSRHASKERESHTLIGFLSTFCLVMR